MQPAIAASFEAWWARYPAGRKGKKPEAARAYAKAVKGGATVTSLDISLAHYAAARALYQRVWRRFAPLMNASTFLNSDTTRARYSEPPTRDSIEYWPPPAGKSWDRAPTIGQADSRTAGERAADHFRRMAEQ